jgi:hypothetical protein
LFLPRGARLLFHAEFPFSSSSRRPRSSFPFLPERASFHRLKIPSLSPSSVSPCLPPCASIRAGHPLLPTAPSTGVFQSSIPTRLSNKSSKVRF